MIRKLSLPLSIALTLGLATTTLAEEKATKPDDPFDENQLDDPDAEKEDEFEDDSAFAEKQAAENAERDAVIEAAKAAARREALKSCPKPKGPSKGLLISQAAMTLGGTITGAYDADIPVDGSKTVGGGSLSIWPEVGIFATKGLLLSLGIGFKATFGDITESLYAKYQQDWWNSFGFDLGIKYLFDTKTIIYPYLGLRFGMDLRFAPDPPDGEVQWEDFKYLVFSVPIGVLIELSRHVALDLGLQFEYDHSLNVKEDEWAPEKFAASQIHLPFGYLGIQGFFPTKRD